MWQPHRPERPEKIEGGKTFRLVSEFEPKGDQVKAIPELVAGVNSIDRDQVLLGVTGSGRHAQFLSEMIVSSWRRSLASTVLVRSRPIRK